jgi:hypothetical protein
MARGFAPPPGAYGFRVRESPDEPEGGQGFVSRGEGFRDREGPLEPQGGQGFAPPKAKVLGTGKDPWGGPGPQVLGSRTAPGRPRFGAPQAAGSAGMLSGPSSWVASPVRWQRQNRLRCCLLRSQPGAVHRGPPPCLTQNLWIVGCASLLHPGMVHIRIACLCRQHRPRHFAGFSQPSTLQSSISIREARKVPSHGVHVWS